MKKGDAIKDGYDICCLVVESIGNIIASGDYSSNDKVNYSKAMVFKRWYEKRKVRHMAKQIVYAPLCESNNMATADVYMTVNAAYKRLEGVRNHCKRCLNSGICKGNTDRKVVKVELSIDITEETATC